MSTSVVTCKDGSDANTTCDYCGGQVTPTVEKFSIAGANMTLGNDLKMNFMIRKTDVQDGYTVKVTQEGNEPVEVVLTSYNSTYYAAAYSVAAKEMTDVLSVEVYDANGNLVSEPFTRTIKQYAMNLLGNSASTDALRSVIVDMLNYGTEAQKFFGYGEDAYANADVTEEQQSAYATGEVQCTNIRELSGNAYATNLSLEDSILMNAFFKSATTEGLSATVSFVNYKGKEVTAEAEVVRHSSSLVKVVVDEIVLSDAKRPVTVTVYQDGVEYGECTESVGSYVARNLDSTTMGAINMAIIKFATSAYNYLGGTD